MVIDIGSTLVSALCCCATLLLFSVSEVKRQAVIALKVMKTLSKTLFESVKGDSEAKKKIEKTRRRILRVALSIREASWRQTQTEELTGRLIKLIRSINMSVRLRAQLLHVCPPQRSWFQRSLHDARLDEFSVRVQSTWMMDKPWMHLTLSRFSLDFNFNRIHVPIHVYCKIV